MRQWGLGGGDGDGSLDWHRDRFEFDFKFNRRFVLLDRGAWAGLYT